MTLQAHTLARLGTPPGGLEGAGPGLASVEAWAIAVGAVVVLLVLARWSTSRSRGQRRRAGRPDRSEAVRGVRQHGDNS